MKRAAERRAARNFWKSHSQGAGLKRSGLAKGGFTLSDAVRMMRDAKL